MDNKSNINKFHKMDLNHYKTMLNSIKKSDSPPKNYIDTSTDIDTKTIQEYEIKYQKLIKNYSPAYLEGCYWYVGKTLTDYLEKESIYKIIPLKLKVICNILDRRD